MNKYLRSTIFLLLLLSIVFFVSSVDFNPSRDYNFLNYFSLTNVTWVNATEDVCVVGGNCLSSVSSGGSSTTTLPASNITDWPVETPSGNIFLTRVQGANNTARVFDPEASVYNADNITSGTLPNARLDMTYLNATMDSRDANTQLSDAYVQDLVGGMVSGNTETGITVTYDGIDKLDFVISSTPTFTTLSTGQGQYELYAMNQDIESTDAVTFANMTVSSSGAIGGNSTCIILYSPDGGTTLEVCN